MKKMTVKVLATLFCLGALVFGNVESVFAEGNDEPTVEETVTIETPESFKVANDGYTQLLLTWDKVANADGYQIYRADEEAGEYVEVAVTDRDAYVDYKVVTDQKYYYKIRAYAGENVGEFTEIKSATPKLFTPKMKKTANVTSSSIQVSWNQIDEADGYYVYRKQGSSGTWKQIATIKDVYTTSYKDKEATGRYYYAVRAYKKVDGETFTSLRANSIQSSVLKKASITVSQKSSDRRITVKWKKIANATGYQVYRKIGSSGGWELAKTTGKDTTSYTYKIPQGKNTYWKVRAIRDISGTKSYALYSTEKSYSFATPKFEFELLTGYGSSVKNIKLKIKNTSKYDVRFYSEISAVVNESNSKYDRELYLVGSSGKKINYSTINAGKTKTITYKVDGSSTRYRADSVLCLTFKFDGLEYVLMTYADASDVVLFLAEDFWAE